MLVEVYYGAGSRASVIAQAEQRNLKIRPETPMDTRTSRIMVEVRDEEHAEALGKLDGVINASFETGD